MEGGRGVRLRQERRERGCGKGVRGHRERQKKVREKTDHVGRVLAGQCVCVSQREKRRNRKSLVGVYKPHSSLPVALKG